MKEDAARRTTKSEDDALCEHRKQERKTLIHHAPVLNRETGRLFGFLGDISPEGLMLFSPAPIRAHRTVPFEMMLPTARKGNATLAFDAKRVWCKKGSDIGLYVAGFQIEHLSHQGARAMAAMIEEFGSRG